MGIVIPFPSAVPESLPGAGAAHPRRRLDSVIPLTERAFDLLAVFAAVVLPCVVYAWSHPRRLAGLSTASVLQAAALFGLFVILLLERSGEYRPYFSLLAVRETERLLRVGAECLLLALPFAFLAAPAVPPGLMFITFLAVPLALIVEKSALRFGVWHLRSKGYGNRKAVILGAGPLAKNIYSVLARSPKLGLDPVAIVDEDAAFQGVEIHASSYWRQKTALVLAGPLSARLFRNLGASVLVIADPDLASSEMTEIMARAATVGVSSYVVSRDSLEPGRWLEYSEVDGMMLASLNTEQRHTGYEMAKRTLDIVLAAMALLLLAIPSAVMAVIIRCTSGGPAIFRQRRVGLQGRVFTCYKFRTLYADSPAYMVSPKSGRDPRITPIGRLLRRTCFDEVPQLWNVLRGEMSLVGPRPEMPFIVEDYSAFERQRLAVKPGITGLWQLSGDRGCFIHQNLEYDFYYIRNRNLYMDLAVLLHTVAFAARGV